MKKNIYCFICFLYALPVFSQQITNVRATADSATITILYDLVGTIEGQLFTVDLYSSHNEYESPLIYVSGEAGRNIKPGTDKKIVWEGKELNNFDGQLTFDVRAVLTFSPFLMKAAPTYKRSNAYQLEWKGGIPAEGATLELYRNKQKISSIATSENTGTYLWKVPAKTKAGGSYQLKVSSTQKPDNTVLSNTFRIRRRTPLVLKALPFAVAGTALYILLRPGPEEDDWLPAAVKPQ